MEVEILAFDFEAALMQPGYQIPEAACMSWCRLRGSPGNWTELGASVETPADGIAILEEALRQDVILVAAETGFDVLTAAANSPKPDLLRRFIAVCDHDRVTDVLLRQKLLEGAVDKQHRGFKHNLASVVLRWCGIELEKDDWRLRFGELIGVHPKDFPEGAYKYSLLDARTTAWAWAYQEDAKYGIVGRDGINYVEHFPGRDILCDQYAQTRKAIAIKALAAVGLFTDPRSVALFRNQVSSELDAIIPMLTENGLLRVELDPDYEKLNERYGRKVRATQKVMRENPDCYLARTVKCEQKARELMEQAFQPLLGDPEEDPPNLTDGGQFAIDSDNAERAFTWFERQGRDTTLPGLLKAYARYVALSKTLGTDIALLEKASHQPFHAHYNTLRQNGRTATGSDKGEGSVGNVQNMPREAGVRECWVAPKGWVFSVVDYAAVELSTFGQVCLWWVGWSDCARYIQTGVDQHALFGASLLGHPDPEGEGWKALLRAKKAGLSWADDARTAGKGMSFGCKGRMSGKTFKRASWNNYGIKITEEEASKRVRLHHKIIREMTPYTRYLEDVFTRPGTGGYGAVFDLIHPYSGRVRAGLSFTDIHNYPFSGLAQDMAGVAIWLLFKAANGCSELGEADPFFGCHPCLFVHDEIVALVPEDPARAHAAAVRHAEIMTQAAKIVLPDVPVEASPGLQQQLSKKAKVAWSSYDDNGKPAPGAILVPWDAWSACGKVVKSKGAETALSDGWPKYMVSDLLDKAS